jgi:hypothetical protein
MVVIVTLKPACSIQGIGQGVYYSANKILLLEYKVAWEYISTLMK